MKKIAVINDLSGFGKCSLTAALPVISAMGVQACPLPTAVLSSQTGYPSYYIDDYTPHMEAIMAEWKKLNFQPDGIYTGFWGSDAQADILLHFLELFQTPVTTVLVDPVMGDQGEVYDIYSESFLARMRALVSHAQVITPNLTEALLLLYGKDEMQTRWQTLAEMNKNTDSAIYSISADLQAAVEGIGLTLQQQTHVPILLITGIDCGQIGTLLIEDGAPTWFFNEKIGGSYSGTGDLFASVLIAGLVKGLSAADCTQKAISFLSKGIADAAKEGADKNDGICFEAHLNELL